jgi:hypothetical protein
LFALLSHTDAALGDNSPHIGPRQTGTAAFYPENTPYTPYTPSAPYYSAEQLLLAYSLRTLRTLYYSRGNLRLIRLFPSSPPRPPLILRAFPSLPVGISAASSLFLHSRPLGSGLSDPWLCLHGSAYRCSIPIDTISSHILLQKLRHWIPILASTICLAYLPMQHGATGGISLLCTCTCIE